MLIETMRPVFAGVDAGNRGFVDTKPVRDAALRFPSREAGAYLGDLGQCQFLVRNAPAIAVAVEVVLAPGVIAEIGEAIIGRIAICVRDFLAWWAWANERRHHEAVNLERLPAAVTAEGNFQTPSASMPRLQNAAGSGPRPARVPAHPT